MEPPDMDATRTLMEALGLSIVEAKSSPEHFGSWFVCAQAAVGSVRVAWDGRDCVLAVQRVEVTGADNTWSDVWTARVVDWTSTDLERALLSIINSAS